MGASFSNTERQNKMTLIENDHYVHFQNPDAPPPEAGLPFEPGPGDLILLEQGKVPKDCEESIGAVGLKGSGVKVSSTVFEVWPIR